MIYYLFLTILVVSIVSAEIYFLGKYISRRSNIFMNNEAGTIALGAVLYFVITFLTFFAFVWISPSILYYVVIFVIKESVQIFLLFLRRETFRGMKINWASIGFTIAATALIPVVFNFGLGKSLNMNSIEQVNEFQTWQLYGEVIAELTTVNVGFIVKWTMGAIASLVIYNIVTSFILSFSKRKNWLDYLLGIVMTLGVIILFNFGQSLESLIGVFMILYAVQLSVLLLKRSRRRYAVIIGLIDVAIWFFQPDLFLTMIGLSVVVALLYTIMNGNKATLFWVQLISPLLIVSSLWIYSLSSIGAVALVIVNVSLYIFMVGIGRLETLDKFDRVLMKIRMWLPIIILSGLLVAAIIIVVTSKIDIANIFLFKNAIWESFGNEKWDTIQSFLYYGVSAIVLGVVIYMYIRKEKIINYKLAIILASTFLFFAHNVITNILTINSVTSKQFIFFRMASFAPLTLLLPIILRRNIKI